MALLTPSGHTVLTPEQRAVVPPKLLDFQFTLSTMYVYEQVLGKKLADWKPVDDNGLRYGDVIDLLYAGLYDIDEPEKSPKKGEIARMYTPRAAPVINYMMISVINESSATSEEETKAAKEALDDPNARSP